MKKVNKKYKKVVKNIALKGKARLHNTFNHKSEESESDSNFLSCGCEHCHNNHKQSLKENNNKLKAGEYTFDFIKLGISIFFLLFALFIPLALGCKLAFYIASSLIVSYKLLFNFLKNIFKLKIFDENFLMIMASFTAYLLGEFFEGAFILILFNLGELLESIATSHARKKIAGLASLRVFAVHKECYDNIIDVNPKDIEIGSILLIKKGEQIPIDCKLLSSSAVLDLKAITGESRLCTLTVGDEMYSGAINVGDAINVCTTKLYKDSMVEKIISSVEGATVKKAKSQKFISTFAKFYTPIVVFVGILIAIIPPFFDGYSFTEWIYRALTFLVVSCPCALIISVPLAFFMGIGSLARKGILVKGSNYIDLLSNAKVAVFDKTGTLTEGKFTVETINLYNNFEENFVLSVACSLEAMSNHPLAEAIVDYANKKGIDARKSKITEVIGKGIIGIVDDIKVIVGNSNFLQENDILIPNIQHVSQHAGAIIYVAVNGKLASEILLTDKIKCGAKECISILKKQGIQSYILSGDSKNIVNKVGKELKVDNVYSELLPEEKLAKIQDIKRNINGSLVYIGDGINDAPSLSNADVGIAMGGLGCQLVIEGADVVLMDDDIKKIVLTIKQSKKIKRIVAFNIGFSILVKLLALIFGVFFSLPVWIAIFADVGVMLLAVANSLRASSLAI